MDKYLIVTISKIHLQIVKKTDIPGYTKEVIECFLPDDNFPEDQIESWIEENNKRMEAICNFLNENNL